MALLEPENVRRYIRDSEFYNKLIDELEFSDADIEHYRMVAVAEFNVMPPITSYNLTNIPPDAKVLVLYSLLANMFRGRAAHAARNQMSYSDGGLTIPIEERYQYYMELSAHFRSLYQDMAKNWKVASNMEGGLYGGSWGSVSSDYSTFPIW